MIGQLNFQSVELTHQPGAFLLELREGRIGDQRLGFQLLQEVTGRVIDQVFVQQFLDGILLSSCQASANRC